MLPPLEDPDPEEDVEPNPNPIPPACFPDEGAADGFPLEVEGEEEDEPPPNHLDFLGPPKPAGDIGIEGEYQATGAH